MATILIGYDLNKRGQDYTSLIEKIKSLTEGWWHCLDSTWFIKSSLTPVQIRDVLRSYVDSNDELLVMDVSGDAAAWSGFDDACSKWLVDNL